MRAGLRTLAGVLGLVGLGLAGLILVGIMATGAASARNAMSYGGEGGGEFELPCPGKKALVGLAMRSGSALDNVAPICAEVRADNTVGPPETLGGTGGGGGSPQTRTCGPNAVVTALRVHRDKFNMVNSVDLVCYNIISKDVNYVLPAKGGQAAANARIFCAPYQEWGTGIFGRSGSLIDKMGIQCERTEKILPAKASPPPANDPGPKLQAMCQAYGDRMATMARELRLNRCDTSSLGAGLKTEDKQVYVRNCLSLKSESTLQFNERPVADLLAKCKAGGGATTGAKTTTVKDDVDLYAAPPPLNQDQKAAPLPNGLRKGQKVGFVSCRSDNWCQVTGGWVFGDFITK